MQIFENTAQSEQTHMDAFLTPINRYGLEDPAQAETGTFTNETLQEMYDTLTPEGAGEHCEVGAAMRRNQRIFDWIDDVFQKRASE